MPDPRALDAAAQRLGERLWQPVREHRDHPSAAWLDRVGNGLFTDDDSPPCWPVPGAVYRFSRGGEAAYAWHQDGSWWVRGWQPTRGARGPVTPARTSSFRAVLDRLLG